MMCLSCFRKEVIHMGKENNNYTAKFKVDISDLKKNITEANKNIRMANAEFKAATAVWMTGKTVRRVSAKN